MTRLLARLCDRLGAYRLADRFRPNLIRQVRKVML